MSASVLLRSLSCLLFSSPARHSLLCLSPCPYADAMVATPIKSQRLSAGDDAYNGGGEWGTPQIVTPAIVGGILLLLFAAYVIWQRRPHNKRSHDYHQVRSEWASKIERVFSHRQKRQRVLHSSAPVTLDDSMRTSGLTFDFNRRSRQSRSDSSDSQTPLTSAGYTFDYPPNKPSEYPSSHSDSPPPIPKRPMVRWWWLFGSRPQQIKSEEPGQRWRVDDPDGSSSGHGHNNRDHRYTGVLERVDENPEDGEDEVIRIGENFASVASTPMTQHFPEQATFVRGMPTVPEHPQSAGTSTPVLVASAPPSVTGTPQGSSAHRSLPPSYDVSQSQSRYPSTGDPVRLTHLEPYIIPPPLHATGHRMLHGRGLSSESFLTTQPPMVVTSTY